MPSPSSPLALSLAALLLSLGACTSTNTTKPASSKPISHTLPSSAQGDDAFLSAFAATGRYQHGRPKAIKVAPDGKTILFLRSGPRSPVQDLIEFNTATGTQRTLLTADSILGGAQENLSPEELARRERMRSSSRGIASFSLSEDGSKILIPLSGRLYLVDRASGKSSPLPISASPAPILDPRFSPDGSLITFVRNDEVHAIALTGDKEFPLTSGSGGTISNGLAEFVAQEEMSRFEGYWLSPDSSRLLYQITDTKGMEQFTIADPKSPEKEPQSWPYPRAGKQNADVQLALTSVSASGASTTTTPVQWDRATYPYVAKVSWPAKPANAPLTILVQNRTQTRQVLLEVNPATGATTPLLTESDDKWINIFDNNIKWLEDASGFLWVTEQYAGATPGKDYPRLELRNRDGSLNRALTPPGYPLQSLISFDPKTRTAYIAAVKVPTRTSVASISLDAPTTTKTPLEPQDLAHPIGRISATFSSSHTTYVESVNALDGTIAWNVKDISGKTLGQLTSQAEKPPFTPNLELVTVGNLAGRNREFHAAIIRPRSFAQGRKYPVIVQVYGGPGSATVNAAPMNYLLQQWHADRGYIVVSIDGRGTPNRGRTWERAIKNDLIAAPLDDQADALKLMGQRYPEMDLTRVGINGWSFGGYFSAMATMRRPDTFHAGVAGAPVAAWEDYDTHYTERYMDLPQTNTRGYEAANVLTYCKDLSVPLLLIHGTADDNVYFMHSLKISSELLKHGKVFEFLPLPGFTHMVADPIVSMRMQQRIGAFFDTHLLTQSGR